MKADGLSKAQAEHESLKALLLAIKEGPEAGLARLEGRTDSDSIRRKLVILLQADRVGEAAKVVAGLEPHEDWAELAINAFGLNGQPDLAERVFEASGHFNNWIRRDKCRFSYAETLYVLIHKTSLRGPVLPSNLLPSDKDTLEKVTTILEPIYSPISKRNRIDSEFEEHVVALALKVEFLRGNQEDRQRVAALLAMRSPVPLLLGEASLQRWVKLAGLAERLRTEERSDGFEARIMASLLMASQGNAGEAFAVAKTLVGKAKTIEEKAKLAQVLDSLAEELGEDAIKFADTHAPELLAGDKRGLQLREASRLIRSRDVNGAQQIVHEIRDESDWRWLQVAADLNLLRGDTEEVLRLLKKAGEINAHPEWFHRTAEIAFTCGKLDEAVQMLRHQIGFEPTNIRAHSRLAFILLDRKQHREAAEEFTILYRLQPQEKSHALNQAISLTLAGDYDAALSIYESLCQLANAPVEAFVARSALLKAQNNPEAGFKALEAVKEKFWDDPRFVSAFMELAHAAQADALASQALGRLQELQAAGKAEGALRAVSIDDIKGEIQGFQKRKREILSLSIQGKLPWLLAEQLMNRVPYWGWALRTQSVDWLNDDPLMRAEFCIYSTNGFLVRRKSAEKTGEIEEVYAPDEPAPVVADLSSLITLHQLGFLEKAAEFFGTVFVPVSYTAQVLQESSKLVLHQKSQKTSLLEVKRALETRRIKVLDGQSETTTLARLDEYPMDDDSDGTFKLRDVAEILLKSGEISDSKYAEFLKVCQKTHAQGVELGPLNLTQPILITLTTLRTIHAVEMLDAVTKSFDVHLTSEDRDEVLANVRGFELFESVYEWHNQMWSRIRKNARFVQLPHERRNKENASDDDYDRDIYLSAYLLAVQQKLSLLADDRACQTVALNERPSFDGSSFGVDQLIEQLAAKKIISDDELADSYLKMMMWRYRFLVPPASVLKTFALRYLSSPPGKPLREIARYVHDCMRDPGLFAGFEASEPPVSMGSRLFLRWTSVVSQFLMELWGDQNVTAEKAGEITRWSIHELLPSPPRTMGPLKAEVITSVLPRSVFSQAFVASLTLSNSERANAALVSIADALGMTPDDYSKWIVEVMNGM